MKKPLNILVIAHKSDCHQIKLSLEKTDIKIELETANNHEQGILAFKNKRYDCLLLDQTLLEENLSQVINKLQSGKNTFPIIIITEQANSKEILKCSCIEVTEYLAKSVLLGGNLEYIIKSTIRIHQTQIKLKNSHEKLKVCKRILINKNYKIEQQQQEINSQRKEISDLSKLKSSFLKIISHELRTPMNAIIGFSQMLVYDKSHPLSEEQVDMISRILKNSKHLLMLLNEIIDYAKIEGGKLKLRPEVFDISHLVDQKVREAKVLAEAKKLSLLLKLEIENTLILNDKLKLDKILSNLLSNAVKFTEVGGIFIKISETMKKQLIITVKDTGIGIAQQNLAEIFKPFTQMDKGNNRKYSGIGIGLTTIKSLVNMMGGKIYIESQIGIGTNIQIELPRNINFSGNLSQQIESQVVEDMRIIKQPSNMIIGNCYQLKQG